MNKRPKTLDLTKEIKSNQFSKQYEISKFSYLAKFGLSAMRQSNHYKGCVFCVKIRNCAYRASPPPDGAGFSPIRQRSSFPDE